MILKIFSFFQKKYVELNAEIEMDPGEGRFFKFGFLAVEPLGKGEESRFKWTNKIIFVFVSTLIFSLIFYSTTHSLRIINKHRFIIFLYTK